MDSEKNSHSSTLITVEELQDALRAKDEQLTVLQSLMADLWAHDELDALLHKIAAMMVDHTEATRALILLLDETSEFITVVAAAGPNTEKNIGQTRERGKGFAGIAWDTAETQFIANSDDNVLSSGFWPSRTQLLAVPLKIVDEVIGVMVLGASSSSEDLRQSAGLIGNFSNLASYAIAAANSMEKTRKDLQNSRAMSEISHSITEIDEVNKLLRSVSKTLIESFDFTLSTFFTLNSFDELHSDTTWKRTIKGIEATPTLPAEIVAESSCYWSYKNKTTACIPRKTEDPRESPRIHSIRTKLNIGCSVTIPVIVSGEVFAVLMVCKDIKQRNSDENELNLLSSIVQQVAAAIYGIQATTAIRHQANHDSLTGLPNRRKFEEELQLALKDSKSSDRNGALLYLDLDGFKTVNDTLGHQTGDTLLKLVAQRLQGSVRNKGTTSRLGGDEFGVVLPHIESPLEAKRVAQEIRQSLLSPFTMGETIANLGTSIGMCFFPLQGKTVDILLRNADEAMYRAKSSGKNNVVCFEDAMAEETRRKLQIEAELHDALDRRELQLHYQPQVDPRNGRVTGFEALVRWCHPERGMVSPAEFIPIAEDTGLINEIGSWVLKESISQLSKWKTTSLGGLKVSINVAASQFLFGDFTTRVNDRLQEFNVEPQLLEVELTESVVMRDIKQVASQLQSLRELGVTVALDDFGTGYSSLSYLQDLPLDVLKIDRAFVARLTEEKKDSSIVNTIMLLASGMDLQTVAEGVENSDQLQRIIELGCTLVQGFYYSKPCAIDELDIAVATIEETFLERKAA